MKRHRASYLPVDAHEVDDAQIAGLADGAAAVDDGTQRLRYGRAGIEEIDIDTARPVVPRGHRLRDMAVPPCPADAPFIHLADAVRPLLAQQSRKVFVAQPVSGRDR